MTLLALFDPARLGLALIPALAIGLLTLCVGRRDGPWPPRRGGRRSRVLGHGLWLVAAVAVAGALALRPQLPEAPAGVDTVLVLDVSRSMLADDGGQTRLEQARRAVRELLTSGQVRRAGLVLVAGAAYWAVPLTSDHRSLEQFVSLAETPLLSERGTDLAHALELAHAGLCGADGSQCPPVNASAVVVVSDGEHFGADATPLVQRLRAGGVTIHAIAVGRGEAVVPGYGAAGGALHLDDGQIARTRPNRPLLAELARQGGGRLIEPGQPLRLADLAPDAAARAAFTPALAAAGWGSWLRDPWWEGLLALASLALLLWLLIEDRAGQRLTAARTPPATGSAGPGPA